MPRACAWAAAAVLLCAAPAAADPPFTRAQMEADAGAARWLVIHGSLDPDLAPALEARARGIAARLMGLDSTAVRADHDVTDADLRGHALFVIGGPRENAVTRALAADLPVRFERGAFTWAGTRYGSPGDVIQLVYPNPRAPRRFLILVAANSPAGFAGRTGFRLGDSDWRIYREGELVRYGSFAHAGGAAWHYDPALDRDRERERAAFERSLVVTQGRGVRIRAAPGLPHADVLRAGAEVTLARMDAMGFGDPRGSPVEITFHPSLEALGALTRDTHAEQLGGEGDVHVALPAGRERLDGHGVAAARLVRLGASRESIWLEPAAVWLAGRYEGETLERSIARLYFGRILPGVEDAAAPLERWRSPLFMVPARALLMRSVYECAGRTGPDAVRRVLAARMPGTLATLARAAGVPERRLRARYGELADSLARIGRAVRGTAPRPWSMRDGFMGGVCLAHSVSLEGGYASQGAADELKTLRDMGARWVSLTPFGYLPARDAPVIRPSADGGPGEETDESIVEAGQRARALGLRVCLKPHLWTRGWIGELGFTAAGWTQFFEQYREFILHHAVIAQREGFDALMIGHELVTASLGFPDRWRALIGDVRRVYTGTLTYGANWGEEVQGIAFWDALDLVSTSFYEPLAEAPTRDVRALRAGAVRGLAKLEAIARRTGKPVLLSEVGYAPVAEAPVRPWEERRGAVDLETQRACYEALIGAVRDRPWIAGVHFWKWFTDPGAGGPVDASFTPKGKPAEAEMRAALRAWGRREVKVIE